MKKCLNCQKEYPDDYSEEFCDCGGHIVEMKVKKIENEIAEFQQAISSIEGKTEVVEDEMLELKIKNEELELVEEEMPKLNIEENKKHEESELKENETLEENTVEMELNKTDGSITLQVYNKKQEIMENTYIYDEITIGRGIPGLDIDLKNYDPEKNISRKHLKILRENNKYYVVRISKKTPIYLNRKIILPDEKKEIKKEDKLVLSKDIGIIISNV